MSDAVEYSGGTVTFKDGTTLPFLGFIRVETDDPFPHSTLRPVVRNEDGTTSEVEDYEWVTVNRVEPTGAKDLDQGAPRDLT